MSIARLPNPQLDTRDLRLVLALSRSGTTARAAEVLHLTQPAVSRALLGLEDRLGQRMFERTPRGLVATAAGMRLLEGAGPMLAALAELEHLACHPTPMRRLRVVTQCYTAYHWLPATLERLRGQWHDVEISLAVEHTATPMAALVAGNVDVALITQAAVPKGVGVMELFSDEVIFAVAPSHLLAAKRTLTPKHLTQNVLLAPQASPAEAQWFAQRVFGRKRPRVRMQRLPFTEAIVEVARAAMGIAVLSEWMVSPYLRSGALVACRLASGPLLRPWRFAFRPQVADAALRLRSALQASVPAVSGYPVPRAG